MRTTMISLHDVGKKYFLYDKRFFVRELIKRALKKPVTTREVWALRHVDLSLEQGEVLGVIGENGAGKSTLLKIISKVITPTEGSVTVNGTVASLLELGAGFHPFLTGRENIYLNGVLLGMKKKEIDKLLDEIVAFSGIGKFIDTPVQYYSSGMYVRLGFAVAIKLNTDILIVDEVLSVGDIDFQRKSGQAIMDAVSHGKTVIFVTHDMNLIRNLCNKTLWIKSGEVSQIGYKDVIVSNYLKYVGTLHSKGIALKKGNLMLIFENGKIDLFWKDVLLTKGHGFYTEFVSRGNAYLSTCGSWDIENATEENIVLEGYWKTLPVYQKWSVNLASEKSISIKIETKYTSDVYIEYDAVTMMVTDTYTSWVSDSEKGPFPETFLELCGQRLVGIGQKHLHIGVAAAQSRHYSLPAIHFKIIHSKDEYMSQVTNTDRFSRCRTLGFSRISDHIVIRKGFFAECKLIVEIEPEQEQ